MTVKPLFALSAVVSFFVFMIWSVINADEITKGRGASFPGPLYKVWTSKYFTETGEKINYTPTGSSDGVTSIKRRMVDFAGSDKPLKPEKLQKSKLYMFPSAIGAIVLAYNIDGVKDGELKLSRAAIDAIFTGKATYWDDAIITKENAGLKLPHADIVTCVRADKSGTTFNFTYFLNKINPDFKISKKPTWKATKVIAGKSNSGVSANIQQIKNSIGYIEYSFKIKLGLRAAQIENKEGIFIDPNVKSFQDAAKYATWTAQNDFYAVIGDPAGATSYPIVAATFILLPIEKNKKNKEVTAFVEWAFAYADRYAVELGYIPLPSSTKNEIRQYWKDKGIK